MFSEFNVIYFALIGLIIQYGLPILNSKKFILSFVLLLVFSTQYVFSPFEENNMLFIMFIGLGLLICILGYKHSKKIEGKIITYINQHIIGTNTYIVSISDVDKIVEKDLKELSVINNKEKYIKNIIEVLLKKGLIPKYINVIE